MLAAITPLSTAQAPDTFRWIDFHPQDDQDVVVWVTRALDGQKWTAIREIGVQYDAALVDHNLSGHSAGGDRTRTLSPSGASRLADRALTHIADGANLRLMDWLLLNVGQGRELGALFDDCNDCQATTYFTALHYDLRQHICSTLDARREGSSGVEHRMRGIGVTHTQVYAVMADENGRETLGTWSHLDYGKTRPAEDAVYRYDLDPQSDMERTQLLSGRDAANMKDRLCRVQDAVPGLSRGQDSSLCQSSEKPHYERKPVTSPPANNQGQSRPPGSKH